ncbi:hypothetical protein LXL04_017738 [Taraxacum kok-saghyz]
MVGHFILVSFLLLPVLTFMVSGQVFWSVNCGESDFYVDGNAMSWMPDTTLISNGVARVVQSTNSISTVLDTLRVFTSRKKNCYSYPVTKGEKLLVRASFNYGNYDRALSPPTFDLHFDGNFWTTVKTSISGANVYEATYVAKTDSVSVCVAQTNPGQFPFMSALEVRSVDLDAFRVVDENRALFLISRFSYGATATLRLPQDRYDRIWIPALGGTKKVTNDAIFINPTGTNNPPSGIFENAITVDSTADILLLGTVSPSKTLVYITTYFSEVRNLAITGQKRSFQFYETTTLKSVSMSDPILPPYGSMTTVRYLYNYTVYSITNISLISTMSSDLPPLINAIEAFNVSEVLTNGTDNNDVAMLILLQNTFNVLGEWSGDPCLPAPYSWDWLNCSNDIRPRVTSLYLDGFELSGSLPDISSMDALEIIVTGNPSMCESAGKSCSSSPGTTTTLSGSKKKKSSKLPLVLGITIPIFFLIWVAVGVFIILRKKNKSENANIPAAIGHTVGGANGNSGGGEIRESNGEEMRNEIN